MHTLVKAHFTKFALGRPTLHTQPHTRGVWKGYVRIPPHGLHFEFWPAVQGDCAGPVLQTSRACLYTGSEGKRYLCDASAEQRPVWHHEQYETNRG